MKILQEIYRAEGVEIKGETIHRTAVRAVILRRQKLLMVYSSKVGDYKFPGGGVGAGESHEHALARELLEECGATLLGMDGELGAVIEYDFPKEVEFDVFKMTSFYYFCRIREDFIGQNLDGYERELGFQPVWIDIKNAIEKNKSLFDSKKPPHWLKRETFVLDHIQKLIVAGDLPLQ